MKPLKIVFMLTFTVVFLSIAVFFVEDITSEIIAERQAEEIQEALQTIFPDIDGANDDITYVTDADFGVSGITQVIEISNNGNPKGYVYTVEFNGFASTITYLLGIDTEGTITGFQVLSQGDTPGYGAQIGDSANWEQFTGMSIEVAGNGDFDGLSGATITTTNWKSSMKVVYEYHLDTYGYTPLTPEQLVVKKKEALAGVRLEEYTNTNPYDNYGITSVHANADETVVVYAAEFVGFNADDVNQYIVAYDLTDNSIIGYETLYSGDSADYGNERMMDPANWTQFEGLTSVDALAVDIDGFSGVSVTGGALESSLANVATYHRWEFEGVKELTPEERVEQYKDDLFPNATFEDVTAFKPTMPIIRSIYDAYNDSDALLGTLYHVTSIGASYSGVTYIEFYLGIDTNGNFTGFRMLDDTETEGRADDFYGEDYGNGIVGDDITGAINLDGVANSTLSYNKIIAAIEEVVVYHNEKYLSRPDSVTVDPADLSAAYPDVNADEFVSIYEDYAYNNAIGNVYEVQDATDAVLGYVYYGYASGNSGTVIEFTWGVAVDGTTQQLHIVVDGQTWDGAAGEYGDYDGSYGTDFSTSTWLDTFEGIDIASILSSPVDSVAGVTNTTSGMIASLETIATYHEESIGGGN